MTAPLARDQHGNPFELPDEAKYWRIRRHTRGRPAEILGRDGEPLFIAIGSDESDLRAEGCVGSIRLDAVDGERRALAVQATYVELGSSDDAVFCDDKGERYTRGEMDWRLKKVCRKAQLRWTGWHALRHTFCSHLAMRGAPPRVIQELAGHSSLSITQRYMHLTPGATLDAIRMLESATPWHLRGTKSPVDDQNVGDLSN